MPAGSAGLSVASLNSKFRQQSTATVVDPLVEEEKRMAENLRLGLSTLLDMHNPAELGSLCGSLGLVQECDFGTHAEKKAGVLRVIADEGARLGSSVKAHVKALELMWEGILFEYLRAEGQPLRESRVDPRAFVLQLWRKRATFAQGGAAAFRPHYMPRHVRRRDKEPRRAADLEGLFRGVEAKELAVKHAERCCRVDSDYRHVVRYLADSTALHNYEQDARFYLVHELESARARIDHYHSSLELASDRLVELEGRHERTTSALVERLGRVEAELEHAMDARALDVATENQLVVSLLAEFLARPGPNQEPTADEGCRMPHTADTRDVAVLCTMAFAKHDADVASVARRADAVEVSFVAARASHDRICAESAAQRARAYHANLDRCLLEAQLAQIQERAAAQSACAGARVDLLESALDGVTRRVRLLEENAARAEPFIWSLLCVDCGRVAAVAAAAALALGIVPSVDVAWQETERWNMDREEVQLRTYEALRGPTPKVSKKKKAGRKKAGAARGARKAVKAPGKSPKSSGRRAKRKKKKESS